MLNDSTRLELISTYNKWVAALSLGEETVKLLNTDATEAEILTNTIKLLEAVSKEKGLNGLKSYDLELIIAYLGRNSLEKEFKNIGVFLEPFLPPKKEKPTNLIPTPTPNNPAQELPRIVTLSDLEGRNEKYKQLHTYYRKIKSAYDNYGNDSFSTVLLNEPQEVLDETGETPDEIWKTKLNAIMLSMDLTILLGRGEPGRHNMGRLAELSVDIFNSQEPDKAIELFMEYGALLCSSLELTVIAPPELLGTASSAAVAHSNFPTTSRLTRQFENYGDQSDRLKPYKRKIQTPDEKLYEDFQSIARDYVGIVTYPLLPLYSEEADKDGIWRNFYSAEVEKSGILFVLLKFARVSNTENLSDFMTEKQRKAITNARDAARALNPLTADPMSIRAALNDYVAVFSAEEFSVSLRQF